MVAPLGLQPSVVPSLERLCLQPRKSNQPPQWMQQVRHQVQRLLVALPSPLALRLQLPWRHQPRHLEQRLVRCSLVVLQA